ncbi:MAG: cyclic nucleotide-binding domain-containing protein [Gammaproteobacteria bacterium]|nr:cyclic nucleotide-binding domain-containing protein [Gammaproteobacteria bacterium]
MSNAEAKIVSQDNISSQSEMNQKTAQPTKKKGIVSNVSSYLFKYGRKQRYSSGKVIIHEGNMDKTVYILLQGAVEVLKNDDQTGKPKVVASFNEGGVILGEMSIFLNEPRSTSVRVTEDALLLEFTGENFIKAVITIPELSLRILKNLSSKLKTANVQVVELRNAYEECARKLPKKQAAKVTEPDGEAEPKTE